MRRTRFKKTPMGFTALGAPSILLVFVLLCLVCFASLSLVSANAELRLAARLAQNTADWYGADALAQERLQRLDALLAAEGGAFDEAFKAALEAEGFHYAPENGEDRVVFYTTISPYTAIETLVRISGGKGALMRSANVVTEDLAYTELPFIWNGVIQDD